MTQRVQSGPVRLARLDGLRAIAACGVAFTYHIRLLFPDEAMQTGIAALDWFHLQGWLFVDMFFVLSGYIFAHVYLARDGLTRPGAPGDFAVARFARLYPLHLVMLVVTAVLFMARPENTPLAFAGHLLMLQAFVHPVAQTYVGPSWSLSIEAVCYVLFALGAMSGPRALKLVTGLSIALAVISILAFAAPDGPYGRDNIPRGLLGFFVGQVLWHCRAPLARVPAWAFVLAMAAGIAIPAGWAGAILPFALLVFPAALCLGLRLSWLELPWLLWLGDRSYAIYLIHVPLIELYVRQQGQLSGDTTSMIAGYAGVIAATLLLSDLAYRGIEKPSRRAIRRWWAARERRLVPA